jgi:hypothetical protein
MSINFIISDIFSPINIVIGNFTIANFSKYYSDLKNRFYIILILLILILRISKKYFYIYKAVSITKKYILEKLNS